ncbi:MAG: sigma-70 family RNA polymerase sigma factor [Bacteroides sp.]|nr:sigma-70 family RNA polymerase sigma factor [Bacteroides sp.]
MSEETLVSTFVRMRKGFLRLANRFLPNEEDASDALQDAFCKLWPRREAIHTRQEAEALTVTTLRNLCIDRLRKQEPVIVELDVERDGSPDDSAEERLAREELFAEVERLIDSKLSPMQRLILRWKEYEERSTEEIAAELDMQPTAVRMQLSRARKIIRECYQERHSNGKK